MNVASVEKRAFPGASTDRVSARMGLLGIGAASAKRSSRLGHPVTTVSPYEDEIADFDQPPVAQDHVFPEVNSLQWGLMNQRRAELIRKKNRQGLTDAEHAEYERLQSLTHAALEKAFPRLPLDDEKLNRLETRLREANAE